jgi:hypothetical protein
MDILVKRQGPVIDLRILRGVKRLVFRVDVIEKSGGVFMGLPVFIQIEKLEQLLPAVIVILSHRYFGRIPDLHAFPAEIKNTS